MLETAEEVFKASTL